MSDCAHAMICGWAICMTWHGRTQKCCMLNKPMYVNNVPKLLQDEAMGDVA